MKAVVIYDTRYGNTEKVAMSLGTGLQTSGIDTVCLDAKDMTLDILNQYDLICIGAPTEWLTASKPMKEFIGRLYGRSLTGKFGFAFDTRLDRPLSGNAAKFIEKELKNLGLQVVASRESATVFLERGSTAGAWLKEGEEKRFEQIGARVGTAMAAKQKAIVA